MAEPNAQKSSGAPEEGPQISLLLAPSEMSGLNVKGHTIVVIDVLRLSTTICYAIHHGAERVIPVETIEDATQLAASLDSGVTVLCGEREGVRIDGFQLGNSPLEYAPEVVDGKTLIITTTNGTRVAAEGEGAREIALAGLVNVSAAARWLIERTGPILIICSGKEGRFALEDAVCAGLLVARALELASVPPRLGDAARAAAVLAESHAEDLPGLLESCEHGRYLASRGFADDIPVCAALDALSTVPVICEGRILGRPARADEGVD